MQQNVKKYFSYNLYINKNKKKFKYFVVKKKMD